MDSILTSIKKLLGIDAAYTQFDADVIMHINSVFSTLYQLGVGPSEGFAITSDEETWNQFIPAEDINKIEMVKSYIFLKVKLLFDAASVGSATLASMERQISEYEWRLNVAAETPSL